MWYNRSRPLTAGKLDKYHAHSAPQGKPHIYVIMAAQRFKVADIKLADWGRKEIELAENEMPGLMVCRARVMRALVC